MLTKSESNVDLAIAPAAREKLAEALGLFLADTYSLYVKTQNFHWNVKGFRFPELHTLFEAQYRELAAATDTLAERIRALGYLAPGSFSEFLKLASVEEGNGRIAATEMVQQLMRDHERISQTARVLFTTAEQAHDHATVDLLADRMAAHEKAAWMLRSILEEEPHAKNGDH